MVNPILTVILDILYNLIVIALIAGIVWLLIPYFFRWFVAKAFDGSYEPSKDSIPPRNAFPPQEIIPKVTVDSKTGAYQIDFGQERAFTEGVVRIKYQNRWYTSQPSNEEQQLQLQGITHGDSDSPLGKMHQIIIQWLIPQTSLTFNTIIGTFPDKDYIVFKTEVPNELSSISTGEFDNPSLIFPSFINKSLNQRVFTYRNGIFCPPIRDFDFVTSPVLLFDDAKNTVMISALDHFNTNGIQKVEENSTVRLNLGPNGEVDILPIAHQHHYFFVFHQGINATFQYWGELLHKYYGSQPKDRYMDVMVGSIGYFTDNGAYYYYNPLKDQKYDTTLIAVKNHADNLKIPYKYYHLDSWWYQKSVQAWKRKLLGGVGRIIGGGLYGGTLRWEPDPNALDMSLDTLYQQLGNTPFTAHNRWYAKESSYVQEYLFKIEGLRAMPDDLKFWQHIMQYCKENHIIVYEQDWMKNQMTAFTHLRAEIGAAQRWLTQMATAAHDHQISIQYCMATPAMWMSSVQFPNVSNARACGDYAPRWPHVYDIPYFMQTSLLASAVGLLPFKDTFESTRTGRINGERCPELMGLVSCLSAGPVAPGDAIGHMNVSLLSAICRKDGRLLKPDRSITPLDVTFIRNSKYYLCSTESKHGDLRWIYLLCMNLWPHRVIDRAITLTDLGLSGEYIAYNWFTKSVQLFSNESPLVEILSFEQYRYWIVAPIFTNGMSLIGDGKKFSTMNDLTFSHVQGSATQIKFDLISIPSEKAEILIYSNKEPSEVSVDQNRIGIEGSNNATIYAYSSEDHLFTIYYYCPDEKLHHIQINL